MALQGDAQRAPVATREELRDIAGLTVDPVGEFMPAPAPAPRPQSAQRRAIRPLTNCRRTARFKLMPLSIQLAALLGITATVRERWDGLTVANQASGEGEVMLYGPIVPGIEGAFISEFVGDAVVVSARMFREALNEIDGDVTVRINSPGGDAWEGSAIYQALVERRNSGAKVSAVVDGIAASAASMVMMAADDIRIGQVAHVMIHQNRGLLYGTAEDFAAKADLLGRFDNELAALYGKRMGKSAAATLKLLQQETWYTSSEAVKAGLADGVLEIEKRPAVKNEPARQESQVGRAVRGLGENHMSVFDPQKMADLVAEESRLANALQAHSRLLNEQHADIKAKPDDAANATLHDRSAKARSADTGAWFGTRPARLLRAA